jgi:hypothetical protein
MEPAGHGPLTRTQAPEVRHAVGVTVGHRLGEQVLPGAAVVPLGHVVLTKVKHDPFG